ncbi:type II toxin-antitoxin system RelE/ParE family toxin [Shinella granuli]|jgi:putative addiction module killer protein|uniref:Putative addiction module killer protein n=1 Tax=Shinella granuli TaxID=323621 RepID=A0A4R2D5U5_SHIGR|nr:type II toxin-antitoxin system RelE/ParE family toxin [Shinella granuli]TCN48392.1 putative addiction module killer protein [Shinella granuli]
MTLLIKQTDTFRKWERALGDRKERALIAARLNRIAYGLFGDVKSVGDGVSEIRIHHGPGYRIYFTRRGEEIIVLLCGGDKGSQKRDIAAAKTLAAQLDT